MAERFTRLFQLGNDLYSDGSPVIICAGTLLNDTVTGSMIAQIKYQNITEKKIVAANGVQGVLESIVQNLVGSTPSVSNVVNSIANNNSTNDDNSTVINSQVDVHLSHSGFMSEADLKKYGKIIGDMTIDRLNETFRRRGLINNRNSRLRPG